MAMLPANQLFMPHQKWPFYILDGSFLPPHAGTTEEVLKKWFFRVKNWQLTVSGTYTIVVDGFGTFVATYSGSQIIPAQKLTAFGEEEAWESADLTEAREIWRGTNLQIGDDIVESQWGFYVQSDAYVMLGKPWGLEASVTVTPEEGDVVSYDPVKVGQIGLFYFKPFPILRDPADHAKLYPRGFLQLSNGYMQGIRTNNEPWQASATQVGSFVIDGVYTMPIILDSLPNPGYTYSGDLVATLNPAPIDGFWTWGELGTGNNPRYDANTGEKTANW